MVLRINVLPLPSSPFMTAGTAELTDGIYFGAPLGLFFLLALQLSESVLGPRRKEISGIEPWAFCQLQKFSCQVFLSEGYFEVPIFICIQE